MYVDGGNRQQRKKPAKEGKEEGRFWCQCTCFVQSLFSLTQRMVAVKNIVGRQGLVSALNITIQAFINSTLLCSCGYRSSTGST